MSIRETFASGIKSGAIKINQNAEEVKAAAEKLSKLSKEELEKRLEDPAGLLKDVGIELDQASADALRERIAAGRSGAVPMAAVCHIDV